MTRNPVPCDACLQILSWHDAQAASFPKEKRKDDWYDEEDNISFLPWHSDTNSLRVSARTCPICAVVLTTYFPLIERAPSTGGDNFSYGVYPEMMRRGLTDIQWVRWQRSEGAQPERSGHTGLRMVSDRDYLGKQAIWQSDAPPFSARFATLRGWIEECRQSATHTRCRVDVSERPVRLLDLQNLGDNNSIRLVYSQDILASQSLQYATLSHCWGPPNRQPIRLLTINEGALARQISVSQLPLNFQNAITVSRVLGIRYLWIDSLCIVQDDPADWAAESSKMSSYYQGSCLTIAAGMASNPHEGFLHEMQPPVVPELVSVVAESRYRDQNQPVRYAFRKRLINAQVHDNKTMPLLQRAWVLQEQVLSPRLVYFTGGQMLWQCRSLFSSEDGVETDTTFGSLGKGFGGEFDFSDPVKASNCWWNWVGTYYERHISFTSDRGPAIAGLIDFVRRATGWTSMLGLWRETFVRDLFWHMKSGTTALLSKPRSQYPSWSWLSVTDLETTKLVYFENMPNLVACIEIIEYEALWENIDLPFTSPLRRSRLSVSGRFRVVCVDDVQYEAFNGWSARLNDGDHENEKLGTGALDVWDPSDGLQAVAALQIFQMCVWNPRRKSPLCDIKVGLLILAKTATGSEIYRRIGTGWTSFSMPYSDWRRLAPAEYVVDHGPFAHREAKVIELI